MQRVEKQVRAVGAAILEDVLFQLFSSFSFEISTVCNSNFDKEKCNHLVIRRELRSYSYPYSPFVLKGGAKEQQLLEFPTFDTLNQLGLICLIRKVQLESGDFLGIVDPLDIHWISIGEVEVPTIQLQERLVDVPCVELREEPTEVTSRNDDVT